VKDKVVVITGASKGIGAELEKVAEQCRKAGGQAIAVRADVTLERDCAAVMTGAALAYGGIDVLVNNAGATMWARFEDIEDVSILERLMQVNFMGAVYCTRHALPYLRRSRGLLVGIASLTALTGVPTRSGYAASKHAMRGFFDSLRIELMGSGVDVTMIYPGFVDTGIRENSAGPDGKPIGHTPVRLDMMSVEECARITLAAIQARKREVVMTARGKLGAWLKLVAPGVVDRMAKRVIEKGS
jgi:short-subunit dehydrogenase